MTDATLLVTEEQDGALFLVETGVDYELPTEIDADLDVVESKDTMVAYGEVSGEQPAFAVPNILNLAPYDIGGTTCYATYDIVYPQAPDNLLFRSTSLLDGNWNGFNEGELIDEHLFYLPTTANTQIRTTSVSWFEAPLGSSVTVAISLKGDDVGTRVNIGLQYTDASAPYADIDCDLTTSYQVFQLEGDVQRSGVNQFFRIRRIDVEELYAYMLQTSITYSLETDTTAPTVIDAYTDTSGSYVTLVFSEAVTGNSGITVSVDGSPVSTTYDSSTSTMITYAVPTIYFGEAVTVAASSSDIDDASGNSLADFSGTAVTNNSTQTNLTLVDSSTDLTSGWVSANNATIDSSTQFTLVQLSSNVLNLSGTDSVTEGSTVYAYVTLSASAGPFNVQLQLVGQGQTTEFSSNTVEVTSTPTQLSVSGVVPTGKTQIFFRVRSGDYDNPKVVTFADYELYSA